jgi:hypothetical protein
VYQQKLSGWVQYQDSFMRSLLKENEMSKVTSK